MEEAVFEPLDAGVALVGGPCVTVVAHLLRDVVKHVAVLLGTFQRELDRVLAPDLQQGASLLLRPGRLSTGVSLEEVAARQLLVWEEKAHVGVMDSRHLNQAQPPSFNLHASGPFSASGCNVASAGEASSSAYSEVSPRTGARRLKYLKETGRPLLENGRRTQRRSYSFFSFVWFLPPAVAVTPVRLLQPLHAGLALLRRLGKARAGHLLRYLGENVAVVHAGFQAVLHAVRRPHLDQGDRLRLRPGRVRAVCEDWCGGSR